MHLCKSKCKNNRVFINVPIIAMSELLYSGDVHASIWWHVALRPVSFRRRLTARPREKEIHRQWYWYSSAGIVPVDDTVDVME